MKKILITQIFIFLFLNLIFGQNPKVDFEGIDESIEKLMDAFDAVGLSVAVVKDEETIYSKGFGYRDLERKLPVTTNTAFGIGSLTKQFTSCLIGIAEQEKKLQLSDRALKFLPGLKFINDEMNQYLNIEDLLVHRSGIGGLDGSMVFFPTKNLKDNYLKMAHLRPAGEFRESFMYSNMGYAILGAIAESAHDQPWSESIHSKLFSPLGMNNSNSSIADLRKSTDFSYSYSVRDSNPVKVQFDELYEFSAGGSINSTADDMAIWLKMLLNGGVYQNDTIIPTDYLTRAFHGKVPLQNLFSFDKKDDTQFLMYGYGWGVMNTYNHYKVSHTGGVSGFTAVMNLFPYDNIGIVVLTNQHSSALSNAVLDIFVRRLLEVEEKPWDEYEVRRSSARDYNRAINPVNKDSMPSLALDSYCGKYFLEGYGEFTMFLKDGNLHGKFPDFTLGFEHVEGDVFYNKTSLFPIHENCPSFDFIFNVEDDKVSAVLVYLQNGGVTFKKTE